MEEPALMVGVSHQPSMAVLSSDADVGEISSAFRDLVNTGADLVLAFCRLTTLLLRLGLLLIQAIAPTLWSLMRRFIALPVEQQAFLITIGLLLGGVMVAIRRKVPQKCYWALRYRYILVCRHTRSAYRWLSSIGTIFLPPIILLVPLRLNVSSSTFRKILLITVHIGSYLLAMSNLVNKDSADLLDYDAPKTRTSSLASNRTKAMAAKPAGLFGTRLIAEETVSVPAAHVVGPGRASSLALWLTYYTSTAVIDFLANLTFFVLRPFLSGYILWARLGWISLSPELVETRWTFTVRLIIAALETTYGVLTLSLFLLVLGKSADHLLRVQRWSIRALELSVRRLIGYNLLAVSPVPKIRRSDRSNRKLDRRGDDIDPESAALIPFLWRHLRRLTPASILNVIDVLLLVPQIFALFLPGFLVPLSHFLVARLWPFVGALRSLHQQNIDDEMYWFSYYIYFNGSESWWRMVRHLFPLITRLPTLEWRFNTLVAITIQFVSSPGRAAMVERFFKKSLSQSYSHHKGIPGDGEDANSDDGSWNAYEGSSEVHHIAVATAATSSNFPSSLNGSYSSLHGKSREKSSERSSERLSEKSYGGGSHGSGSRRSKIRRTIDSGHSAYSSAETVTNAANSDAFTGHQPGQYPVIHLVKEEIPSEDDARIASLREAKNRHRETLRKRVGDGGGSRTRTRIDSNITTRKTTRDRALHR